MLKIGLTGKIGSGKTTVLKILEKKGARIFNCDRIIHRAYDGLNNPVSKAISQSFSGVEKEGKISRKKLAEAVFNDRKKLEKLEEIVHPFVVGRLKKWLENGKKEEIYVAEVPLLFEKGLEKLFDKTVLVKVKEGTLTGRLKEKYGFNRSQIKKRLSLYLSGAKKEEISDFIVRNNLDLKNLEKEVSLLWQKINKI